MIAPRANLAIHRRNEPALSDPVVASQRWTPFSDRIVRNRSGYAESSRGGYGAATRKSLRFRRPRRRAATAIDTPRAYAARSWRRGVRFGRAGDRQNAAADRTDAAGTAAGRAGALR